MREFPSWIKDSDGKCHWLTDREIREAIASGKLKSWDDATGHQAIEVVLGVRGKHLEGREGLPEGFASDIRCGHCNQMARVEPRQAIENVSDLLPPGFCPIPTEVRGGLSLGGYTGLTALPAGLHVWGYLSLVGCTSLTALPDGLHVGGWLGLDGCTGLTALPAGLHVRGDLGLGGCTSLTTLPADLHVGGNLALTGCTGLTVLPDGLHVWGNLYLGGCTSLTALPDGLHVGGDLYLRQGQRLRMSAALQKKVVWL